MEDLLDAHSDEIAAVIVEPMIQAAGGMIIWPEGYLKGVRDLCTKYNVLLIADEVATGFGRTGKMFACEHESVTPDIICLSKGITNGYMPLAVTLATDEIYNMFLGEFRDLKTFFHGHSYTGNPLACAAAIASINIFEKDATLRKIPAKSDILYNNMLEIAELPHVGNVRHKGLVGAVELVKEKDSRESYPWEDRTGWKIAHRMREYGVILRPLGNVMVIMPPLTISNDNLDYLMKILKKTIIAITGQK
jgi:adenosylmethionine-8-amino-7-oxononanoate aminotransferase